MRSIVISVDESPCSKNAVSWALKNVVRPKEDRITLLHVAKLVGGNISMLDGSFADYPVIDPMLFSGSIDKIAKENSVEGVSLVREFQMYSFLKLVRIRLSFFPLLSSSQIHRRVDSFMTGLRKMVQDAGIPEEHTSEAIFPEGTSDNRSVGACIVSHAEKHNADLVVLGTRGLGSMKGHLMELAGLGSVSDYVVHHTNCPVTVVHPSKQQEAPAH
mmetsp:Transcript_7464/g.33144  ORF Transcript_7464/g.33144 Transcript_7464/m.33144 type:complete len:216 (-) Transcript_7464:2576-3223(-)